VLLGLAGFLVSVAGSWRPSYWGDEAASVLSAERSLPSLFRMLGNVDAVHGTYYLFLHGWIDVFGASELATRLPSALAIGVATAGTAVLARMLVNTNVAVIAGLVFAVLPRVTYMGAEARSTALATMVIVWSTVLLVRMLRSPAASPRERYALWALYALLMAGAVYLFLYSILLLPVHALAVLLLARPGASARLAWVGATAGALLLAVPVLYWGVLERDQISFIARRAQVGVLDAAVRQWFGTPALAVVAWALIGLGCLAAFLPRFRRSGTAPRNELLVLLAWAIMPSAALLIGTHLIAPMYALRYLSICTPAAAILVAVGIGALTSRWVRAGALALLVALAAPGYVAQRTYYAKDYGSDWRQVSEILHDEARPGDAVVFDESTRPSQRPRLAKYLYPAGFVGLVDVTLERPHQDVDGLWDVTVPLADASYRLAATNRVWVLQNTGSREDAAGSDLNTLQQLGFTIDSARTVNRTIIFELTR
jgi:mannosyltransferase